MRKWIDEATRLRMPFFGHRDSYFLGTGAVGASGDGAGAWDFAIGPDYTSPNFLKSERLSLYGKGVAGEIPFEMRRLRGCGAFFGLAAFGGAKITVTDVCAPNDASVLRYFTFENTTDEPLTLYFTADVTTDGAFTDAEGCAEIVMAEGAWCFGNRETRNWAERRMKVTLPGGNVCLYGTGRRLCKKLALPVGGMVEAVLWHDFAYGDRYAPHADAKAYLGESVRAWREWLGAGAYPGGIADWRVRDAAESLLLSVKMQQNRDGGMIAGIRKYANSYIRDTHGGMRLLVACGHLSEVEKLLANVHTRWAKAGYIPNWWSMGSDTFIGNSFHNDASEITAYYLFMARDYLAAGGDADFARALLPSLRWAADAQADFLEKHDLCMDFNGDETEQYCVLADGEEYGLFGHHGARDVLGFDKEAASFTATVAAAQSLLWFASFTGEDRYAALAERVKARADELFWDEKAGRHGWIRDAKGLRDSCLTNYALLPLWLRAPLPGGHEKDDALAAVSHVDPATGFLPNCPGAMDGFCGHTLGLALWDMVALNRPEADALAQTILNGGLLGRYGTVSEFYGPGGTPNGHNCRPFEGGVVGEALIRYALWKQTK